MEGPTEQCLWIDCTDLYFCFTNPFGMRYLAGFFAQACRDDITEDSIHIMKYKVEAKGGALLWAARAGFELRCGPSKTKGFPQADP